MKKKKEAAAAARRKRPLQKIIVQYIVTAVIILVALLMLVPFLWMISASMKMQKDVMSIPIKWIPEYFYIDNYKRVLHIDAGDARDYHFLLAYWNSIKVSVISTAISILSSLMAGYAFAKLRFKGSNVIFIVYLSQMMIPSQLTLIPRFVIFSEMSLTNTHMSLIVPKIVAVSSCFMFRQAFLGVPDELRDAARIDGAGEFRTWAQVMVPMVKATMAAQGTVQFLESWNSYLDPLIFLSNWRKWTLTVALDQFVGIEGTQYNLFMAASCLAIIPVLVVFLFGQKYFMRGLTVGAVKG